MIVADFSKLEEQVSRIENLCSPIVGEKVLQRISLDQPKLPFDELYFIKLVAWSYALIFETGIFFRFSKNLLRASDANAYGRYQRITEFIRTARTVQAHNLKREHRSDQRILRNYDIWMLESGGNPIDWAKCIETLVDSLRSTLIDIEKLWITQCGEEWSQRHLVEQYLGDCVTHWEAHEFDSLVATAAEEIGLEDFNSAAFRKESGRLDRWRKLVGFFGTRRSAEEAIGRAILREITDIFGEKGIHT